ncbi:MAG: hypothetical protein LWW81_13360 [Rhodocyclales bacterium]|nr:hypothetical protein [Rhodocyclales bacterium]
MKRPLLLALEDDQLALWRDDGKRLHALGQFAPTPEGQAACAQQLASYRGQACRLLINAPEEQLQQIHIPPLRGRDRRMLIQRKLEQAFPGLALRQVIAHQREEAAHQTLTCTALPESSLPTCWRDLLHQTPLLLCGIYTPCQIASHLLSKHANAILLSTHAHGFRAIQQVDRKITYTRYSAYPEAGSAAQALIDEAHRLLRHPAHDSPPALLLISNAETLAHFQQQAPELAAQSLPLPMAESASQDCTTAYLAQLSHQAPPEQLAPATWLAPWRLAQRQQYFFYASLALLAAALIYAGLQYESSQAAQQASQQMRSQATGQTNNETPNPEALQQLQALAQHQPAPASNPQALVLQVSRWLDQNAQLTLLRLDWEIAPNLPSTAKMREILRLRLKPAPDEHPAAQASLQKMLGDSAQVRLEAHGDLATLIIEKEAAP